ncbi:MAG TPA: hypothetical protein VN794_11260, partial [Methylomirabilota bacterium]|nr:hypothetical protein [Methylomirabilota bacterium]
MAEPGAGDSTLVAGTTIGTVGVVGATGRATGFGEVGGVLGTALLSPVACVWRPGLEDGPFPLKPAS